MVSGKRLSQYLLWRNRKGAYQKINIDLLQIILYNRQTEVLLHLLRSVWALCDRKLRTLSGGEPSSNKWIILCASDKSVRYAEGVEAFFD